MAFQRAISFSRLERCISKIQADHNWSNLGCSETTNFYANIGGCVWNARKNAVRRCSLSNFSLERYDTVAVFRDCLNGQQQ